MKIRRLISITDTRTWEEGDNDRWFPIPGSGVEHCCDRCGRGHEVHALVELVDGSQAVMGKSCGAKDSDTAAALFTKADNAAKSLRALQAEEQAFERKRVLWQEVKQRVDQMPDPEITVVVEGSRRKFFAGDELLVMGGVFTNPEYDAWELRERLTFARDVWRRRRQAELGAEHYPVARVNFTKRRAQIQKALQALQTLDLSEVPAA